VTVENFKNKNISTVNLHSDKFRLCVNNSAKLTDENEVTPQTNYVKIYEDGRCVWEPRYEMSVTQCPVDATWFPFDEQTCNITFESWLLDDNIINLHADNNSLNLNNFEPSESWSLAGM